MKDQPIHIQIYHKREKSISTEAVWKLSDTKFRAAENSISDCRLTVGTEFETRMNKEGRREITRITKDSDYVMRRFMLNGQFNEAEYQILGDEIMKQGGFWQVDFGSIATVNLPQNSRLDLDEIFRVFDFHPTEFIDE